jgi:hypothetical protein
VAIILNVSEPSQLLQRIRSGVVERKIETWKCDADGDFTHVPPQWMDKAWFRPVLMPGSLIFGLVGVNQIKMSKGVYGVYHGRFIEMLLMHFDNDFSSVTATSQKDARADRFN